jgi:hypothetical protein
MTATSWTPQTALLEEFGGRPAPGAESSEGASGAAKPTLTAGVDPLAVTGGRGTYLEQGPADWPPRRPPAEARAGELAQLGRQRRTATRSCHIPV